MLEKATLETLFHICLQLAVEFGEFVGFFHLPLNIAFKFKTCLFAGKPTWHASFEADYGYVILLYKLID